MKSPKISVVIPSLNKVKFIGTTLESIVSQKYPNLELIIQDGGSTDGTLEIIRKFARRYPKEIKWESGKDSGQLDAINKGLSRASGEILTFINADDAYEPKTFDTVANYYNENPNSLWFAGRGRVVDKDGEEIVKLVTIYKNFLLSLNSRFFLLITNYLMGPSVFITDLAYQKYGPFSGSEKFVTEYDLWLNLSKVKMPVVINRYLSKFRIEPLSKTKRMSSDLLEADMKIVKKYTRNPVILTLHAVSNSSRLFINKFV